MQRHEIRAVRSSVNEDYAWVSLWYRAEARKLDVLNIVCDKVASDPITGHLYLERHDQRIACYGGAKKVRVSDSGIELHLNRKGVKHLKLDDPLLLVAPERLSGWKKAVRVLSEMAVYPPARVIEVG